MLQTAYPGKYLSHKGMKLACLSEYQRTQATCLEILPPSSLKLFCHTIAFPLQVTLGTPFPTLFS